MNAKEGLPGFLFVIGDTHLSLFAEFVKIRLQLHDFAEGTWDRWCITIKGL